MKSLYLCLLFMCATAVAGCSSNDSSLADEDVTVDEIAKYEAELAAISGDDAYEDVEEEDDDDVTE